MLRPNALPPLALALAVLLPGCSIRQTAVNKIGDALAETGSNFASDEDPELVGEAIPFGLKTMEGLLETSPKHEGLLLAAASGFVQYAYGWVQMEADVVEAKDLARATELRERARKLYLRARNYGMRGLEVDFPGLATALARAPKTALGKTRKEHVPLLYWTAMGWAGAMSLKSRPSPAGPSSSIPAGASAPSTSSSSAGRAPARRSGARWRGPAGTTTPHSRAPGGGAPSPTSRSPRASASRSRTRPSSRR